MHSTYTSRLFLYVATVLHLIILSSCKKFLDIKVPRTQIVSSTVFSSDATATAALKGIYSQMSSSNGFASGNPGGVTFLVGFSSDEFNIYTSDADYLGFYTNS